MLLMRPKCNIAKKVKPLKYKIVDDGDKVPYVQWNGTSDLTESQIMSTTKSGSLKQEIISFLSRFEDDVEVESKYIEDYCETKGYSRANTRNTLGRMREKYEVTQSAWGKYIGMCPKLEAVA